MNKKLTATILTAVMATNLAITPVFAESYSGSVGTGMYGDVTLTAIWSSKNYTVSVDESIENGTVVAAKDPLELWDNIGRNYRRVLKKEEK